jgi:hypothetical protein
MQGELQNICKEASAEGLLDRMDSTMFTDLLLTLSDAGLIEVNDANSTFYQTEPRKRRIKLKCTMDDVDIAVGQALGSQPFFASLMQRVKARNSK